MPVPAASGDTWGISGPMFLFILITAFILALFVSSALRSLALRGRSVNRDLHPYEVAYLVGGRHRVVWSSLAALRTGEVIDAAGNGEIRIVGEPRMPLTPLDQAVLHAISQGMNTSVRSIPLHPAVRAEVDAMRGWLAADGLAANAAQRRRARLLGTLPLLAVLAAGFVRLVAGLGGHKPVGLLVMFLFVATIITLVKLQAPRVTRAGKRVTDMARARNSALSPSMSPSWATYGSSGAALGVALFGTAALVSLDPQFASSSQISHRLGGMATGSSGCSSSSSCGSSSCGGGCGGGCGG